jgi:quercetin dioxygenase-like cupin family protein
MAEGGNPMIEEKGKTKYPDPLVVAGDVYKLLMENDRVRVFDIHFKPGQKAVMHGHPDHVVYVIAGGTLKLTLPDGKSQEIPAKTGQAMWIDAGPHETVNIGSTEAHLLAIELKEPKK